MLTPSALESELRPDRGRVYRIVEAQHRISNNRLADNNADQELLEILADQMKPVLPESAQHLPWLLASPFCYGLGRPSRFRAAHVLPEILYASEAIETAVAEVAHWRMAAFSRSPGFRLPRTPTPMSAFSTLVTTKRLLDLLAGSLTARRADWPHPFDYAQTQALADVARTLITGAIRTP